MTAKDFLLIFTALSGEDFHHHQGPQKWRRGWIEHSSTRETLEANVFSIQWSCAPAGVFHCCVKCVKISDLVAQANRYYTAGVIGWG